MRSTIRLLPALLALALVARAASAEEDAAALLRQGKVAETVERDPSKALDLYRRAFEAGGTSEAARDAALAAAPILEARGEPAEALKLLAALTERMGAALDEASKRRVHAAMSRLVPEGVTLKTPLGEVTRGPAGIAAGSPLDQKIQAILSRIDGADPAQRTTVEASVLAMLRQVGKEALPTLERSMVSERPERAEFAARAYAQIGGLASVAGLERTLRTGDGFARGAAVSGARALALAAQVGTVAKGLEVRIALASMIDRVVDLEGLDDKRAALREVQAGVLEPSELMERHQRGGAEASFWLSKAVERRAQGSLERAVEVVRSGAPESEALLTALGGYAGGRVTQHRAEGVDLTPAVPDLAPRLREDILALLFRRPLTKGTSSAVVSAAATVATTVPEKAEATALGLWRLVLAADAETRRKAAMELVSYASTLAVPHALFEDASSADRFFEVVVQLQGVGNWGVLLARVRRTDGAYWDAVAPALARLQPDVAEFLASQFARGRETPPPARWLDLLLAQPPSGPLATALAQIAGRLGGDGDGDAAAEEASRRTWAYALKVTPEDLRGRFVDSLLSAGVAPPHALFAEPDLAGAWFEVFDRKGPASLNYVLRRVGLDGAFWDAFVPVAPGLPPLRLSPLLDGLSKWTQTPPPRHDAAWIPTLRALANRTGAELGNFADHPTFRWIARAAARSGSPEFVALLREAALRPEWRSAFPAVLLKALPDYSGPGRVEFALDALSHPNAPAYLGADFVSRLLPAQGGEAETKTLEDIARKRRDAGAGQLVHALVQSPTGRAAVIRLVEAEAAAEVLGDAAYRRALIDACGKLHLKEGVPFLLREFRSGPLSANAASAMDDIRAYHERLASFEAWSKGEAAGGATQLAALLKDPDPEIRRAAALSLGGLGEKEALPTLVRLAKEDPDARVRAAALQSVEKLSK